MNYTPKDVSDRNKISALLPTRGRPEKLDAALRRFNETVHHHHLFDVWVYVDEDDFLTRGYIDSGCWKNLRYQVNWIVAPPALTMGRMCNTLWQKCASNPGIYLPAGDDYIIKTMHWDDELRSAFDSFPDRIGVAHIPDPGDAYDDVTWPVMSAEWLNALGYQFPEYFPFWYGDIWLGEISKLTKRIIRAPILVEANGGKGKTPRMRNLLFWNHFYINTLDERIEAANRLSEIINPGSKTIFDESHPMVCSFKASRQYQTSDADLIRLESNLSVPEYYRNLSRLLRYSEIELRAISHICEKIEDYATLGNLAKVQALLKNLKYASVSIDSLDVLLNETMRLNKESDNNHAQEHRNQQLSRYELLLKYKSEITSRIQSDRNKP